MHFQELPLRKVQGVPFPIVPFAGIADDVSNAAKHIESDAVSQERRQQLGQHGQPAGASDPVHAATPQGFIFDIDAGNQLASMALAISDDGQSKVSFTGIDRRLQEALTRNRVFAVLSTDGFGKFSSDISIANWIFSLKLTLAGRTPLKDRTVLIIKSFDRTIRELAKDPGLWAPNLNPNQDISELQSFILGKIHDADNDPVVFGDFLAAIDSIQWNGVLALNCGLSADSFPEQMRGLTSGLPHDLSGHLAIRAHHVGVQLNSVSMTGPVDIARSSVFGVVQHLEVPFPPPSTWTDCDISQTLACFHVPELVVVFGNSRIKQFRCTLQLLLKQLFDEAVVSPGAPGVLVELKGSYEHHADQDVYTFVSSQNYQIPIDSAILESVHVSRVQFASTVNTKTDMVVSRFTFWGNLKFKVLSLFDVLSFDELDFANLAIKLETDAAGHRVFSFEPGDISFDISVKPPRLGSLLSLFPLKLKGLEFSPDGFDLPKLGFFPLLSGDDFGGAPDIQDLLPHFGLVFDLDLGSLGSLIPSIHGFHADVLLWWRKKSGLPTFGFGLRLPESTGGKLEIGLEGVVKLIIEKVEFKKQSNAIVLALRNCALEVLGKRFPSDSKLLVMLFTNKKSPQAGPIGWYASLTNSQSDLAYIGAGERVCLNVSSPPQSITEILKLLESGGVPHQVGDQLDVSAITDISAPLAYCPNSGWILAGDLTVFSVIPIQFLFSDPTFYGLRLLDTYEIQYRKVSDSVGEYYIDVPPPISSFDLGVVNIILGQIGVAIFTNGDFKIDVGFPGNNFDFSRSFYAEVLPFTGSGGFYIAKASSDTTALLPHVPPPPPF